jgi:hypothetical protein
MSTTRSLVRASAGTLFTLLCASAAQPAPEDGSDPEAARVAVEALARELSVDPESLFIASSAKASYPNVDLAVHSFKVEDRKGVLHGIAVDSKLRPWNPESLATQERAARVARFGALEPALMQKMERSGLDPIPVTIWLRDTTKRRWDRPAGKGEPLSPSAIDELYANVVHERAAALEALGAPILDRVRAFDPKARANDLAPVLHATLRSDALSELARDPDIDAIYEEGLPLENFMDVVLPTTKIDTLHMGGLTGRGVKVSDIQGSAGRVDSSSLLLRPVVQDLVDTCSTNSGEHSTEVAGVMVGRRLWGGGWEGTAPNIELRSGGSCTNHSGELENASTRGVRWGARIVNLTWGIDPPSAGPAAFDRFYDEIVLNEWRTVTVSAGNTAPGPGCFHHPLDGTLRSPQRNYNGITVGGFDDKNTVTWSDDSIYVCSSFVDPPSTNGDREVPQVAAPAVNIHVVGTGVANMVVRNGTSFAAPMVAGLSALLIEQNSRLAIWPEIIRATLMATAVHNIEGSTTLSDIDGAGGIDAGSARSLIDMPQRWGGQRYTCNGTDPLVVATLAVSPRTRHRIVLSWDTDPAFADYATRPSVDIDLRVRNANGGGTVARSLSFDNTYEIVEFDSWLAGTFIVEAVRFRCDLPTWLGWAWHTLPMPRLMPPSPPPGG